MLDLKFDQEGPVGEPLRLRHQVDVVVNHIPRQVFLLRHFVLRNHRVCIRRLLGVTQ